MQKIKLNIKQEKKSIQASKNMATWIMAGIGLLLIMAGVAFGPVFWIMIIGYIVVRLWIMKKLP